ncbi:MAG: hypothetical protein P8Z42_07515, partial [Anaerolineales bacterium]
NVNGVDVDAKQFCFEYTMFQVRESSADLGLLPLRHRGQRVVQLGRAGLAVGLFASGILIFDPGEDTADITVLVNSFCRSGPSIDYDKLTTFTPGSQIPLAGYYQQKNGTIWWNVIRPDTNTDCWIFEDLVSVCIPLDDVPLLTPPPTPTPRPLPGGGGGGGGLHCDPLAHSEAACGDGAWDDDYHECDCSVLCGHFGDQASCEAHSTWYCSWNGSACVVP